MWSFENGGAHLTNPVVVPAGIVVTSDDGYTLDGFGVQILTPGSVLRLSFDIAVAGTAHLS